MRTNKGSRVIISFILMVTIIFSCLTFSGGKVYASNQGAPNPKRDDFLIRCYAVVFDREPDQDGWNYWMLQMITDKITGTALANKFLFSEEYINKNVSDEQYIADLYELFLGREADQDGYAYWTEQIRNSSREDIFTGFANSEEFYELCLGCDMDAGYYTTSTDIDHLNLINLFVCRLYSECLNRSADMAGLRYWVEGLINGSLNGASCAASFVFSNEYMTLGVDIGCFVLDMYRVFMDRVPVDDPGYSYWIEQMEGGLERERVFEGFVNSPEFETICSSYGINRGFYVFESSASVPQIKSVSDTLENLKGVTVTSAFKNTYEFYVEQPVDWNDPDGQKFNQLVTMSFSGWDKPNVCEICGYEYNSFVYPELTGIYDSNSVVIEHRFFGVSMPEDLEADPYKYAKYDTMENMAKDTHHILELLKTEFRGKWVMTGMSKGGIETGYYAAVYPNDASAFVCYSAPFFSELVTPGISEYLYTKIGNDIYGEEKAEEYRQYVLDFQIALLEARDEIQPAYIKSFPNLTAAAKLNGITEDEIYDRMVIGWAWSFWQTGPDTEGMKTIIDIAEAYRKGDHSYINDIKNWWSEDDDTMGKNDRFKFIMYDIMTEQELGNFRYEYQYLRDELKKRGSKGYIATTEEREKVIGANTGCLDPKFYASTKYSNESYVKIVEMTHTIGVPVIQFYGARDPYAYFKLPVPDDNPNIHVFTAKNKSHERYFADTEVWAEAAKILDPIFNG